MRILKWLLLNLTWCFGFRAVMSKEPSDGALIIYAKMGTDVGTRHCVVCKKEYWVMGNVKVKGHVSLVCSRRKCYLEYHMNKEKYTKKKTRVNTIPVLKGG